MKLVFFKEFPNFLFCIQYYNKIFKSVNFEDAAIKSMRQKYDKIVNKCVNLYLLEKFNLKGYTTIVSCSSNQSNDGENLKLCNCDFFL